MAQVADHHQAGEDLPQDGGQGRALHPHAQGIQEEEVQHDVGSHPHGRAQKGILGAAVSPDQQGSPGGEQQEGDAQGGDTQVGFGQGEHLLVGPEEVQDRHRKHQGHSHQDHAADHQHGDAAAPIAQRLPGLPLALEDVKMHGSADAEKQGHRPADHGDGRGHGGGGVAQVADPLADKHLVR